MQRYAVMMGPVLRCRDPSGPALVVIRGACGSFERFTWSFDRLELAWPPGGNGPTQERRDDGSEQRKFQKDKIIVFFLAR